MDGVSLPKAAVRERDAEQVPAVAGPWTSFFVAVLFLLLFPLLPMGAELLFTQRITVSSLALVTATYAISLSMSSRNLAVWAVGFLLGIVISSIFGWSMGVGGGLAAAYHRGGGSPLARPGLWLPVGVIGLVFGLHLWERFVRHVRGKELFPEFLNPVR